MIRNSLARFSQRLGSRKGFGDVRAFLVAFTPVMAQILAFTDFADDLLALDVRLCAMPAPY